MTQSCPACGVVLEVSLKASPDGVVTTTPPSPEHTLMSDYFWFGKYRGRTLESVMIENPGYIIWCHHNVDGFAVSPENLRIAQSRAPDPIKESYNRSWGSDRHDDDLDYGDDIPF